MDEKSNESVVGSLESRGISVDTQIDQNILSPGAAKSVRFRVSKPSGYSSQEVDDFVQNIVVPSIEWYRGAIYHRDKAVHLLGQALDQAETDVKNLRGQIRFLEVNNSIQQGIGRNDDDKEAEALMKRLASAEDEVNRLRMVGTPQADAETEKYIEQITEQYNELSARYETETSQLHAQLEAATIEGGASSVDPETEKYIEQITEQYNELSTRYETETSQLHAQLEAAVAATDMATTQEAVTSVDPETEKYIEQITEQYNELSARYETETSQLHAQLEAASTLAAAIPEPVQSIDPETEKYIEQITEQYNELSARYESETNQLHAQLEAAVVTASTLAATTQEAASSVDPETEKYIEQITEQYNELLTRYNDDIAALQAEASTNDSPAPAENNTLELEQYVETVSAQYNELIKRYEEDTASLMAQLETASATSTIPSASDTSPAIDPETETYISQITEQYNELMKRYEEDTGTLQSQLETTIANNANNNNTATESTEEAAYIDELTARYAELVTRYEQDVTAVPAEDSLVIENENLKARIEELESASSSNSDSDSDKEAEAEEKKEARALLLATEDRNRAIDGAKYSNLPPGIRPDDLE